MKKILGIFLSIVFVNLSYGQVGTWVRYMALTDYNYPTNVFELENGNLVIAGTCGNQFSNSDVMFFISDTTGNIIKQHIEFSENLEYVKQVIMTSDSGYFVTGLSNENNPLDYDGFCSKYDKNFNKLWTSYLGNPNHWDQTNSSIEIADGFIVTGYYSDTVYNNKNFFLAKLNLSGSIVWQKSYNLGYDEELVSIKKIDDNNFISCGNSTIGADSTTTLIVKSDGNGDTLWTRKDALTYYNFANDLVIDNSFIYITGECKNKEKDTTICLIEKYDLIGNRLWINPEFRNFSGNSIIYNQNNELVIFGNYYSESGDIECLFLKLNNGGWFIGSNTGGGEDIQNGLDIIPRKNLYGYIALGQDFHGYAGIHGIELFKTESNLYFDFNDLDTILDIQERIQQIEAKFIPNPSNGNLLIIRNNNKSPIENLIIYNNLGLIEYYQKKIMENTINLNLKNGLYIIEYTQKNKRNFEKMIIEN